MLNHHTRNSEHLPTSSRIKGSSTSALPTSEIARNRRVKFLQRIVHQIEVDRYKRTFRNYVYAEDVEEEELQSAAATETITGDDDDEAASPRSFASSHPSKSIHGEEIDRSGGAEDEDEEGVIEVEGETSQLNQSPVSPRKTRAAVLSSKPPLSTLPSSSSLQSATSAQQALSSGHSNVVVGGRNGSLYVHLDNNNNHDKSNSDASRDRKKLGKVGSQTLTLPRLGIKSSSRRKSNKTTTAGASADSDNHHTPQEPSSTTTTTTTTSTTNTATTNIVSTPRQLNRKSSFPLYGTKSGTPPTPKTPKQKEKEEEPTARRGSLFSWKICTPTNWKRRKSHHEILLERKWERRNGRQSSCSSSSTPTQSSRFFSVFKQRSDGMKLTAGDRIRQVLKRAHFYGDDIKRLPLVRFRRAVRTLVALLKTVKISRDDVKARSEPPHWFDEEDIQASKRAYEMFGISFDAYTYRAKREIQVSNETKAILSMAPGTRSDEQMHVALVSLSQAVPEFGEFPKAMQEALVRVGWYETFEARRIIIREGHMADNFYLILSGSAVVTIRERNGSGDYFGRTAAVLQKGNSFGELALIYGGKRSATVTCKDNVELLAVGRDDYIDIFMHKTKDGDEPEHIKFLKQIKVFCDWPIHSLPLDDPSVFLYTYVRRGMVLCKDSNQSEWIYVIKSGSCRVLTALNAVKPTIHGPDHNKDLATSGRTICHKHEDRSPRPHPPPSSPAPNSSRRTGRLSPIQRSRDECPRCAHAITRAHRLPSINSKTDHEVQESAAQHLQELEEIMKKRSYVNGTAVVSEDETQGHGSDHTKNKHKKNNRIFVNLLTLASKDVCGLESVVLSVFEQPTSTSLVSDGAECIMINKKFFIQKLTEDCAKQIRKEIRPLPSEEVLQKKLQTQTDWDTYRAITVADFVEFRRQMQNCTVV